MSCIENTEVYIPQEASITTVPVQALPRSIRKKVLAGPLHLHGDQPATFITPVELRGIGTTQNPSQLPLGQNRLPVVTSNFTAVQLIKRLVHSGEISLQFSEPRVDRVLYNGRNSIVVYDGKLFLSVRKKKPRDWPMDPPSSTLPEREAPPPDSTENLRQDGGTNDVIDSRTSEGGAGEAKDHGKCTEDAQEEANNEPTEEEPEAATPTRDVSTNTISLIAKIKQELDRKNQLAWAETSTAGEDKEDDHANAECLSGSRQISRSDADELNDNGNRVNETNADAGNAERRSDRISNAKMFRGASDDANQSTENVKSGDDVLETLGGKNVTEKANSNGADAESCVKTKLAEANRVNIDVEIADAKTSSKLPANVSDDVNTIVTSAECPVYANFSGTESQSDRNKRCEDVGEIAEVSADGLAVESRDTAAISQAENRPGKTEGGESRAVSIELVPDITNAVSCVQSRSGGVQGSLAHDDVLNSPDDVVEVGESRVEGQTSRAAKSAQKLACRKRLSFGNAEEKLNTEPGDDLITEEHGAKATSSIEIVEIDDDDRVFATRKSRANAKRVRFKDEVVESRDPPAGSDDVIIIDDDEQIATDIESDSGDEVEIVELAECQAESRRSARSGDAEESPAKMNASKRKIRNSGNDTKSSVKSQISEVQRLAAKRFKQNDSDSDEERKDRGARASQTSDDSSSESELVIDLHRSDARPPGQVDANMEDLDVAEADDERKLQDVATVERSANEEPRVQNRATEENQENDEIQREKNAANGEGTRAQNDTNETGLFAKASGGITESSLDKLCSAVADSEAQTSSSSDAEPMEFAPDDLDVSGDASYANEETFASLDDNQADVAPDVSISGADVEENVRENQSAASVSSQAANQSEAQQGACVQPDLAPPPADGGSGYAELNRQENITLLRRRLRGMEDKLNAMINNRR